MAQAVDLLKVLVALERLPVTKPGVLQVQIFPLQLLHVDLEELGEAEAVLIGEGVLHQLPLLLLLPGLGPLKVGPIVLAY